MLPVAYLGGDVENTYIYKSFYSAAGIWISSPQKCASSAILEVEPPTFAFSAVQPYTAHE
jgi:hypothetical protein